jgi:predicted amidohydrolase YtcJ
MDYSSAVIRSLIILALASVGVAAQGPLPRPAAPTLVFYNAKVITVDAAFSVAEAIALGGERILAVGTSAQMRARALADVAVALSARARTVKPAALILSNSDWHEAQLKEQRLPLRDDLDRMAPDNPVT